MQMTIEIPDELARQLEPERKRLAEIIRRGLSELDRICFCRTNQLRNLAKCPKHQNSLQEAAERHGPLLK